MKLAVVLSSFAMLLGMSAGASAEVPAQLRGKSVTASWTEERVQRVGGVGEFVGRSFSHQLIAYISTEGRVFARRTVWRAAERGIGGASRSGNANSVGESGSGGQKARISGRILIVTSQFAGGVRMARIEFSPDFSGCTANVILGRENGTGVARGRSLINGSRVEIKEAHVANTSCTMQDGNLFAQ